MILLVALALAAGYLAGQYLDRPRQETAMARRLYAENQDRLHAELRGYLDQGMQNGPALREAVSRMKTASYQVAKATLGNPLVREYNERRNQDEVSLAELYGTQYWDVDALVEDMTTGQPDFKKQRQEREAILKEAVAAGVDPDYITGTGEGTFRGVRYKDPAVRDAVEAYENAQETMQPYWEVKDLVDEQWPDATDKFRAGVVASRREQMRKQNGYDNPINRALEEWYGYKRPKPSGVGPSLIPTVVPIGPPAGRSLIPTVVPIGGRR